MPTIHPIIFLSLSDTGSEIVETIKKESKRLHDISTESRYVRYIGLDKQGNINNSIDDSIINVPLFGKINKLEDYKSFNQKRLEIKSVFEKTINSVYNLENINYAAEKNLIIGRPQIVILGDFDFASLSPFIISLLQSFETFTFKGDDINPQLHLILVYNSKLASDSNDDTAILKNTFFKEIESSKIAKPFVWLIDIINEKSINLNNNKALYYSISQFVDLLYTSATIITAPTSTMVEYVEKGKPCMYSTFGYSLMHFPAEKIKEYLKIHANHQEFSLIVNDFQTKFEIIAIKDETTKFFKKHDFENISLKISKKENSDEIFVQMAYPKLAKHYDIEYEEVLSKKLSIVNNPTVISKTNSNDFFHQIQLVNKKYEDDVYINYSSELDASKKRELVNLNSIIQETQISFLDEKDKGINYAILFGAMLCNNQAAVQSMLEGRYVDNIPSLNNLQDIYRGRFIGDQVLEIEKLSKIETDNVANKTKLIQEFKNKLPLAKKAFDAIIIDPEVENLKYNELKAQIEDYEFQINKLGLEIIEHNEQIEFYFSEIQNIKNDFEQLDPRKELHKKSRNEHILEDLEEIQNVKIPEQDEKLSKNYTLKNEKLEERKKFIFWRLLIIPVSFFIGLFSLDIISYTYDFLPDGWFTGILEIILAIEVIYYIIYLIKFYYINKSIEDFLDEVISNLSEKRNLLSKYLELTNKIHFNNFSFEADLIAYYMVDEIIKKAKVNQDKLGEFKELIITQNIEFGVQKEKFKFNDSPFEFCIITNSEIENIYNATSKSRVVNRIEGDVNLSKCYLDYLNNNNLNILLKPIEIQAQDIYERKVESESLRTILFNESPNFPQNINTSGQFTKIVETSRPLLRTSQNIPLTSSDIPYTQNIIVGKFEKKYETFLASIKFGDIKIDENNNNTFGVFSIKSNFPAFIIYDVASNEEISRNNVTRGKQGQYYINESAATYSLVPALNVKDGEVDMLGYSLIAAITNKDIIYNNSKELFETESLGPIGVTFEEIINNWKTNVFYDLLQQSKKLDDEIWKLDETDLAGYLAAFTEVWTNMSIEVPIKFEEELASYYFAIKGTSDGWNKIAASFKSKRKSLLKK
jgi:hypothetical protein